VAEAFLSELEWEATLKCTKASLCMLSTKCTIKYGLNHTVDGRNSVPPDMSETLKIMG